MAQTNHRLSLSIGIIFKNDIRCIERCLRSLEVARHNIPCEVVMADTGSTDGSREVAERYADILIDFPWVNDFSAARNAVMDRCSGEWFLTIDTDEWMDEDISWLMGFLTHRERGRAEGCTVIQRNYNYADNFEDYADFRATRMLRMSTGLRYSGSIHESWVRENNVGLILYDLNLVLHHDGYVDLYGETGRQKRERNLVLLRQELEKEPDNIRTLLQFIESGMKEDDYLEKVRLGVSRVRAKGEYWKTLGPPLLRYAVFTAQAYELAEFDEWVELAKNMFPDSAFTQIDVTYTALSDKWAKEEYENCVSLGEQYLYHAAEFRAGRGDQDAIMYSILSRLEMSYEQNVRTHLSLSYFKMGQAEKALDIFSKIQFELLSEEQTADCVMVLRELYAGSMLDMDALLLAFYEGICSPKPSKEDGENRQKVFIREASLAFDPQYWEREKEENYGRSAMMLFLPLAGRCEVGTAASVLSAESAEEMRRWLETVEDWDAFPISALNRALLMGVSFPLSNKPMKLEEMDDLCARMAVLEDTPVVELALRCAKENDDGDFQTLIWIRALFLSAVQVYKWEDEEEGMMLVRGFARVERSFLTKYYAAELLQDDAIRFLPKLHRFGWYCGRALDALDTRDFAGYARCLRQGLVLCESMKPMAEFLLGQVSELAKPSPELLVLAERVRTILAAYGPEDPAVQAVKASPVYQRVAYLIEGSEV